MIHIKVLILIIVTVKPSKKNVEYSLENIYGPTLPHGLLKKVKSSRFACTYRQMSIFFSFLNRELFDLRKVYVVGTWSRNAQNILM